MRMWRFTMGQSSTAKLGILWRSEWMGREVICRFPAKLCLLSPPLHRAASNAICSKVQPLVRYTLRVLLAALDFHLIAYFCLFYIEHYNNILTIYVFL